MPYITLETYPPLMLDYENEIENPNYDEELLVFTVPYPWLYEEFKRDNFGVKDFEDFLIYQYTWDDTQFLYARATTDKVIVHEEIIRRFNHGLHKEHSNQNLR